MAAVRKHEQQAIRPIEPWRPPEFASDTPFAELREIDVHSINVAPYQRDLKEYKVRRIVRNWKSAILEHPVLSHRSNGTYFVIDGQHRIEAIRRMDGRVPQVIKAIVWEGLSVADEAEKFWETQTPDNRTALSPEDIHNARIFAGDPDAMTIAEIVSRNGFRIGPSESEEQVGRIKAVKHLYVAMDRYGPEILNETLGFIGNAWGTAKSPEQSLIAGTSLFLAMYPDARTRPLAKRIGQIPQDAWIDSAKRRAGPLGLSMVDAVASLLHDGHNKAQRAHRLGAFDEMLFNHRSFLRVRAAQIGNKARR